MSSILVLSAALCLDFAAKLVQECTFNCPNSNRRSAQKLIGDRKLNLEDGEFVEDSPFLNLTFIDFYTRLWDVYKYGNETTTGESHSIFDFDDADFKVADDNESIVFLFHMDNATSDGGSEHHYFLNDSSNMSDQELSARLLRIIYDDAESLEELDKMMSELEDEGLEDEEEGEEEELKEDEVEDPNADLEMGQTGDYLLIDHTFRKTPQKQKFVPQRSDEIMDDLPIKDPESAYEHNRRVLEKELEFLSKRPSRKAQDQISPVTVSSSGKKRPTTSSVEDASNRRKKSKSKNSSSSSVSQSDSNSKSKKSSKTKSISRLPKSSSKKKKSKSSRSKSSSKSSTSSLRRMDTGEKRWRDSRWRSSSSSSAAAARRRRRLANKGKLRRKIKQLTEKLMSRKDYRQKKRPHKVRRKKKEYLVPALLGLGSLLGFGFGTVYVDRELNNFTFNPTITYEGDNETVSIFDRDTFANTQLQNTGVNVMTSNANSQSNSFAQTVIPVIVNSEEGERHRLLFL